MTNRIKKLALGLFLTGLLSTTPVVAWDGNGCCPCDPCESCFAGVYFIYENVIVKPYFSHNYAYFLEDPNNVDGQTAKMFDWDYEYSPRIELGWINQCGMGVRGRYWHFDGDTCLKPTSAAEITVGFAGDAANEIQLENADEAKFRHCLDLDVVDFEFAYQWCNWTYSVGGRYAWIDHKYNATELAPDDNRFFAKHDFEGGGLTAAVEYLRPVWCGFSIFTKARGSFLYGDRTFKAANAEESTIIRSVNDTDVIAVGELQLGVDYRTSICNFCTFFRFAIETQYWIGGGSAGPGNNAVFDETNYQNTRPEDANLGFFGFNIGLGIIF